MSEINDIDGYTTNNMRNSHKQKKDVCLTAEERLSCYMSENLNGVVDCIEKHRINIGL